MQGKSTLACGLTVSAIVALAACSPAGPDLPDYTGTTPPGAASPTAARTSTTTSAGPSTTTPDTPSGLATSLTMQHEPLPASVGADARPVADGWFAYWDYLAEALFAPDAPSAIDGLGRVATGAAAQDVVRQITELRRDRSRIVGQTRVLITSASVAGATGSLCSVVMDRSYAVDQQGTISGLAPIQPFVFQATLTMSGGTWRVSKVVRPASC